MTQNIVAGVQGEGGAIGAALTEVAWGEEGSTAAARKSRAGSTRGRRAAPGG